MYLNNTDRNILVNFLQVVIYLALVANIYHETWEKNVLQVNVLLTSRNPPKYFYQWIEDQTTRRLSQPNSKIYLE